MFVVQRSDDLLLRSEMLRQHIVDVAEQRNIVAADNAGDTPDTFVVLPAHINQLALTGDRIGFLQITRAVILLRLPLVLSFPNHNLVLF